jgi:hypothetical protein
MQQSVPTLLDYSEGHQNCQKTNTTRDRTKKRQLFNQIGISTNQQHMRKYHVGANVWGLSADILGFTQLKLGSDHDPLERIKDSISNGQMASFKFDQLLINAQLRTAGKGLLNVFSLLSN